MTVVGKRDCMTLVKGSVVWDGMDALWCVIEVLLDSLSRVPVSLGNLPLQCEMAPLDCWSESKHTVSCKSGLRWKSQLPLICVQSFGCFSFLSFKMTDAVPTSVSSRSNVLISPSLQPVEPEVREAYFPEEVETAVAAYLWCAVAEHFHLLVGWLIPWQFSLRQVSPPPPLCFLGKTNSSAISSLVKRKMLFIPQRPAVLLLSMAVEVVEIKSSLSALRPVGFVMVWVGWFGMLFLFFPCPLCQNQLKIWKCSPASC